MIDKQQGFVEATCPFLKCPIHARAEAVALPHPNPYNPWKTSYHDSLYLLLDEMEEDTEYLRRKIKAMENTAIILISLLLILITILATYQTFPI